VRPEAPHLEEGLISTMKTLTTVLVALFSIGIVGSAILVIVTFIEDFNLLLEKDEKPTGTTKDDGYSKIGH
jgi:hypothetical protein